MSVKEHFDNIYKQCEKSPHQEPSVAVEAAVEYLKKGTVLDLGAGSGRDSIFLAKKGFEVTSVDISPEGLSLLKETIEDEGLKNIQTVEADVAEFKPSLEYDNILCIFVLHFLKKQDFMPTLNRIMSCTTAGGINVVSDLTKNGPLYSTDTIGHWVDAGELQEIYEKAGWEILDSFTYSSSTMRRDAEGKPFQHESDHLIARKK